MLYLAVIAKGHIGATRGGGGGARWLFTEKNYYYDLSPVIYGP